MQIAWVMLYHHFMKKIAGGDIYIYLVLLLECRGLVGTIELVNIRAGALRD